MKKILLALIVAASVAGCQTVKAPVTPAQAQASVAKVQAYTRAACSFIPTAATVLAIFKASSAAESVLSIGGAICNAVAPNVQAFVATVPTVNGVVIRGVFVK